MQGWTKTHIGITFFPFLIITLKDKVRLSFYKEKAEKTTPQARNKQRKRSENKQEADCTLPVETGKNIKKKIRQKRFSIVKMSQKIYEISAATQKQDQTLVG